MVLQPFVLYFTAESLEGTEELASAVAEILKPGDIIGLEGHLGAGKTEFVRAVADVFGVARQVSSPSFTIENEYGPLEYSFACAREKH